MDPHLREHATRAAVIERLTSMIEMLNDKTVDLKRAIVGLDQLRSWATQALCAIEGDSGETWRAKAHRLGIALSTLQRWSAEMDALIKSRSEEL